MTVLVAPRSFSLARETDVLPDSEVRNRVALNRVVDRVLADLEQLRCLDHGDHVVFAIGLGAHGAPTDDPHVSFIDPASSLRCPA